MDIYIGKSGLILGPYNPDEIQKRLDEDQLDGTELAWHEGLDGWVNLWECLKGLRALDEETLSQVNKIRDLIADGHEDTAWQLVQSLNNPKIYEGLMEGCYVNEGSIRGLEGPEYLREKGEFYIKLLVNLPSEALIIEPELLEPVNDAMWGGLNLDGYQISDVSALEGLDSSSLNVHILSLNYNQISDVSALANLDLEELYLNYNQISDVSALARLTQLTRLALSNNQISDMSALKELTQLRILELDDNQISDVSPLKELTQLEELYLKFNHGDPPLSKDQIEELQEALPECNIYYDIMEVNGIKEMITSGNPDEAWKLIQSLDDPSEVYEELLRDFPLGDDLGDTPELFKGNLELFLKLLTTLPEESRVNAKIRPLTELSLEQDNITDEVLAKLGPLLEKLPDLKSLSLDSNQITDLTPLAGLTQLTELILGNWGYYFWGGGRGGPNQITDLTPLKGLTNLEILVVEENPIDDLSPLTCLPKLKYLQITGISACDFDSLVKIQSLEEIDLTGSIPKGSEKELLRLRLSLPNCEFEHESWGLDDSDFVGELDPDLEQALAGNQLTNISLLAGLTRQTCLDLSDNLITDISPLAGLTQLTTLNLNNNQISDVSPLKALTQLKELKLDGNADLTKEQIEELQQALPKCEIEY